MIMFPCTFNSISIKLTGMVAEIDDSDVPYEEEVLRNSYNVKSWMRYIDHKANGPKIPLYMVYERALKELPCSYKIWYKYLCLRRRGTRGRCIDDPEMNRVINCYERALVFLHKVRFHNLLGFFHQYNTHHFKSIVMN